MSQLLRVLAFTSGVFLTAANGQDPLKILPQSYRLVFENSTVRVIRVSYAAHQRLPVHDHPRTPTIYVYLADSGPVRFSHMETPPFALVRPPEKAGTFRVSPGRLETHSVENLGNIPSEFLRIELKQVPLKFQENSFRGAKPFDLKTSVFWSRPFRIERVVSVNGKPVEIGNPDHPSLIVVFSDETDDWKTGQVYWMEAHRRIVIHSGSELPSHVLRIVFA
jgi:hypothetical protein